MRIRIVQRPPKDSIDGIRLDLFETGYEYEVGNGVGSLMLAEGWAEPVQLEEPPLPIPFSETDPFDARRLYSKDKPPVATRETFSSSPAPIDRASELKRRRRRRRRKRHS